MKYIYIYIYSCIYICVDIPMYETPITTSQNDAHLIPCIYIYIHILRICEEAFQNVGKNVGTLFRRLYNKNHSHIPFTGSVYGASCLWKRS